LWVGCAHGWPAPHIGSTAKQLYYVVYIPIHTNLYRRRCACHSISCPSRCRSRHAREIQVDTYETKHVVQGYLCPHDGPNPNKIEEILQNCQSPLLTMSQVNGSQTLVVDVEAYTGKQNMLPSKVWSDSLGDSHHNTSTERKIHLGSLRYSEEKHKGNLNK
jgi:hypothetical protein